MFALSVFQETVAKRQREAVRDAIETAIRQRTFSYTDVLMAAEPVQTFALEYIDGLTSADGKSSTSGDDPKAWDPVRLVCLSPNGDIKVSRWGKRRIWGTAQEGPSEKVVVSLGPDALVDDVFPTRVARNILRQRGWPIRQARSRGANEGSVVEWRWLEREAKSGDPAPEVLDLYNEILARTKAADPPPAATKQTKSAGATAQAHP